MNQATTQRLSIGNRRDSVFHFKRLLEAFATPMAVRVAADHATEAQGGAKFRVLHVRRKWVETAPRPLEGGAQLA